MVIVSALLDANVGAPNELDARVPIVPEPLVSVRMLFATYKLRPAVVHEEDDWFPPMSTVATGVTPPNPLRLSKRVLPLKTHKAIGLVMVMLVPAVGDPLIKTVDAFVIVSALDAEVGALNELPIRLEMVPEPVVSVSVLPFTNRSRPVEVQDAND